MIKGKALYTPKGAANEYGRIGCNFYVGCPHGCTYCYLKRGAPSAQLGGSVAKLKKCFKNENDAAKILKRELDRWLKPCQEHGIFLSFTTDPLIKATRSLTTTAIIQATIRDIPVYILTKDATFIYDEGFMEWIDAINIIYRDRIHFGFTLTGRDDMEPNASTNYERIMAMRKMYLMGFSTFASIEPVIDWGSSEQIIRDSIAWCEHYKIGLRSGVEKKYYDIPSSIVRISILVKYITDHDRSVYLKQSIRKMMSENMAIGNFNKIVSMTVDENGKSINS